MINQGQTSMCHLASVSVLSDKKTPDRGPVHDREDIAITFQRFKFNPAGKPIQAIYQRSVPIKSLLLEQLARSLSLSESYSFF